MSSLESDESQLYASCYNINAIMLGTLIIIILIVLILIYGIPKL